MNAPQISTLPSTNSVAIPKAYTGHRNDDGDCIVAVRLPAGNTRPLRHVDYHSDSFEWGYGGSGPADLALSILADFFGEKHVTGNYLRRLKLLHDSPRCWTLHQDFKREFVATWGRGQGDTWEITTEQIAKWVREVGLDQQEVEADGRTWLHVSVSKPSRSKMPTYEDIQTARKLFIGEERECYMVFPTKDRYINVNPVLHLWCCLDQPEGVLPRFEGLVKIEGKEVISV